VDRLVTEREPVESEIEGEVFGMKPKYLQYNLWTPDADPLKTVVEWTLLALLLPCSPAVEYDNLSANQMFEDYPDLFEIVTLVKVSVLEHMTRHHPNQVFVESVLEGLRDSFWLLATMAKDSYPVTHDELKPIQLTVEKEQFLDKQIEHKRELGQVSADFGESLLLGMYCMPFYVVPKAQSTNWHLMNDQSARLFSLNSMVDHRMVKGYPLDNLSQLGEHLVRKH